MITSFDDDYNNEKNIPILLKLLEKFNKSLYDFGNVKNAIKNSFLIFEKGNMYHPKFELTIDETKEKLFKEEHIYFHSSIYPMSISFLIYYNKLENIIKILYCKESYLDYIIRHKLNLFSSTRIE